MLERLVGQTHAHRKLVRLAQQLGQVVVVHGRVVVVFAVAVAIVVAVAAAVDAVEMRLVCMVVDVVDVAIVVAVAIAVDTTAKMLVGVDVAVLARCCSLPLLVPGGSVESDPAGTAVAVAVAVVVGGRRVVRPGDRRRGQQPGHAHDRRHRHDAHRPRHHRRRAVARHVPARAGVWGRRSTAIATRCLLRHRHGSASAWCVTT